MNKYLVKCKVLYWYDNTYIIEAESENDITDEVIEDGDLIDSEVDALDQINSIDSIELLEDENED